MIITVLEGVVLVLAIAFVLDQIVLPLWKGEQVFPYFRKPRRAKKI